MEGRKSGVPRCEGPKRIWGLVRSRLQDLTANKGRSGDYSSESAECAKDISAPLGCSSLHKLGPASSRARLARLPYREPERAGSRIGSDCCRCRCKILFTPTGGEGLLAGPFAARCRQHRAVRPRLDTLSALARGNKVN